ncbi:hypothetical protein BJY59DRAFT_637226, partial [Rhodotorula toruloides]
LCAQMASQTRQLAIKTGVVNRCALFLSSHPLACLITEPVWPASRSPCSAVRAELQSYRAEAVELKKRADAMEAAGEDEYEVRQQRKVQAESQQMIPDTEKRLAKAVAELEELVV